MPSSLDRSQTPRADQRVCCAAHAVARLGARRCSGTRSVRSHDPALCAPRAARNTRAGARGGPKTPPCPTPPAAPAPASWCQDSLCATSSTWHRRSPQRASRRPPCSTDVPRECCGRPGLALSTDAGLGELGSSTGAASAYQTYEVGIDDAHSWACYSAFKCARRAPQPPGRTSLGSFVRITPSLTTTCMWLHAHMLPQLVHAKHSLLTAGLLISER
jgi:hypothetical protein